MKLTVLVDNNTLIQRFFYGEPGVSYFVQDEDNKVLFDVGYSDAFIRNAQKMNIDLLGTDFVVLSHGHLDHTWGLVPLIRLYAEAQAEKTKYHKPTLIAHPLTFLSKIGNELEEIGPVVSKEKLCRHFNVRLSKRPIWLTSKLVFLGQIERKNDFEAQGPSGKIVKDGLVEDDYVMDDSALVYKSVGGMVIITGCSHAGICNIVEHAQKICKDDRVVGIVGGLHLLDPSEKQLQGTLEYMRRLRPDEVYACHCTDLHSKMALSGVVNLKEVGVGLVLEYE